jgi:hypothetical protein
LRESGSIKQFFSKADLTHSPSRKEDNLQIPSSINKHLAFLDKDSALYEQSQIYKKQPTGKVEADRYNKRVKKLNKVQ